MAAALYILWRQKPDSPRLQAGKVALGEELALHKLIKLAKNYTLIWR
jgi:hypothetical protein